MSGLPAGDGCPPPAPHRAADSGDGARPVVSRTEWLKARTALLEREKELTRARDALARERQQLPWVRVDKRYVFDAPEGPVTLEGLFAGRSQLFVKHFMLGPGQEAQCVGCALEVDHIGGLLTHLENHDVTYVAVARATIAEIERYRQRMGWRFRFVSSFQNDFNYDFNVSFRGEDLASGRTVYNYREAPVPVPDLSGNSVFYRDADGQIFHTYSAFGRGGEEFITLYRILDCMPKGRAENGPYRTLADWVRPHDAYGQGGMVEANGRYHPESCRCSAHG
jgi:predicted dithiol-disulfide oxidoreductase (DUF899 family)